MRPVERALEQFFQQSEGMVAFAMVMFILIIFAVLRLRAPWMFFSVIRVIGKLLIAPARYTVSSFRDAADIGQGVAAISERDRASLLQAILFTLRVMVAVTIAAAFAMTSSLSCNAFFPTDYAVERVAKLESARAEAEASAQEASIKWQAYQQGEGTQATEDPQLSSLRVQLQAAEQSLAQAEQAYQEELAKYETETDEPSFDEEDNDEDGLNETEKPSLARLVGMLSNYLSNRDPESKSARREARRAAKTELCTEQELTKANCAKVMRVIAKWEAVGDAKLAVARANGKIEPLEAKSSNEQRRKRQLQASAEESAANLTALTFELAEAKSAAGIQFEQGLFAIGTSLLTLWVFVWALGLSLEVVQLTFRWMDDVGTIREAVTKPGRNAQPVFESSEDLGMLPDDVGNEPDSTKT